MSIEFAKKFFDLIESNKEVAEKMYVMKNLLERDDVADEIVINKIILLAKEHGFDFTADELVSCSEDLLAKLSADKLAEISGGVNNINKSLASVFAFLSLAAPITAGISQSVVAGDPSKTTSESAQSNTANEIDKLKQEIENLKKELEEANKKAGTAEAALKKQGEEKEIKKLKKKVDDANKKAGTAEAALKKQGEEKDAEIKKLKKELEEAKKYKNKTNEDLRKEIEKLKSELDKEKKSNRINFKKSLKDRATTLKGQLRILATIINGYRDTGTGKFNINVINSYNNVDGKTDRDRFRDALQHVANQLHYGNNGYYFKSGGVAGMGSSKFERGNMQGLDVYEFLEICKENKIAVPNVNTEGKIKYSTSIEKNSSSLEKQVKTVFEILKKDVKFDLNNITEYNTSKEMGQSDQDRLKASAQHIASQITTVKKTGEKIFKGKGWNGRFASTVRVDNADMKDFIDFCKENKIKLPDGIA